MSATRGSLLQLIAKGNIDKYLYLNSDDSNIKKSVFKGICLKSTKVKFAKQSFKLMKI